MTTAADLLNEYGAAIRGDWSDIDGRDIKRALLKVSDAIHEYATGPLPDAEVERLRDDLGLCSFGGAHWPDYCDFYECAEKGQDQ